MASCKTVQWAAGTPHIKLTVIKKAFTQTSVTLAWRLTYISEAAIVAEYPKDYVVSIADTAVHTSTFDINNKIGNSFVAAGAVIISKTASIKSIPFKVSFTFNQDFGEDVYIDMLEASGSILVDSDATYTACGLPSELSAVDNGDNTVTISCKIGASGINNIAEGAELFITCDGTTPSTSNYRYRYSLFGSTGDTVSTKVSFAELPSNVIATLFGASHLGDIKFIARTVGDAGSTYDSGVVVKSVPFTWHGLTISPQIVTPKPVGETTGRLSYRVTWEAGSGGVNNAFSKYAVSVYNLTTKKIINTYNTTNLYYDIPSSDFTADNIYRFDVTTVGAISGFDGKPASSGQLTIKTINKLPSPVIVISEGNTVPSIDISSIKTYVNIGSGNILKLSWNTPAASNNAVDSYKISVLRYDTNSVSYIPLYKANIGDVNEFYIKPDLFESVAQSSIPLRIYVEAISKYGAAYNGVSNVINIDVVKGCGIYTKVDDTYSQPVLKRALAFARLGYPALIAEDGLALVDDSGKALFGKVSSAQDDSAGWALLQEANTKDSTDSWQLSDIRYEALTDTAGEVVTDITGDTVYVL